METRFWVLEWLEENKITSLSNAANFLPKHGVVENLRLRAETGLSISAKYKQGGQPILAGTGIDFIGGNTVCPSPTCMRGQVDELFKRVWHYFDRIIVADVFTPALLGDEAVSSKKITNLFLTHLPPLLYLREIGAEHLVEFVPKVICEDHWRDHANEEGLGEILKVEDALTDQLRADSNFFFAKHVNGEPGYWMDSREATTTTGIPLKNFPNFTEQELQRILANLVFEENLKELTFDVTSAHRLKVPLGAVVGVHERMLAATRPPTTSDVVFRLELPILDGVPTKELVQLRKQEHESFLQFRDSLSAAIEERRRLTSAGSAESIANQIQQDLIEPALNRIRRRLAASETSLAKKAGVAIFLGTLVTTCGILCGIPPLLALPAGIATVIPATNSAAQKHIEEKQAISLDDMYFLWKASGHFH